MTQNIPKAEFIENSAYFLSKSIFFLLKSTDNSLQANRNQATQRNSKNNNVQIMEIANYLKKSIKIWTVLYLQKQFR